MEPHLTIKVVWQDEDMLELDVHCCNQDFSGRTKIYTTYDCLAKLAEDLTGFPRTPSQMVTFASSTGGTPGLFDARFYCFDPSGHTVLRAKIESEIPTSNQPHARQRVELDVQFEAIQLDTFVAELSALVRAQAGQALLLGIRPYTQNIRDNG